MSEGSATSVASTAAPLLEARGLRKAFGAQVVTDGLDLTVRPGETLGIIGPNGAGKTTLLNLIGGDLRLDAGTVRFDGIDLGRRSASQRARLGIGRTYQIPRPFSGMTVYENLLVAATHGAGLSVRAARVHSAEMLALTALTAHANQEAGQLRLLDRKRLELARALASKPKLLLLDEIAGGLTEYDTGTLVELLTRIKHQGVAIVWIEHVVHALNAIADTLVVVNFGSELAKGVPHEVIADPVVRRVYMGIEG